MPHRNLWMRPAIASVIIATAWAWATLGSGGSDVLSTVEFLAIDVLALVALTWRGARWQAALAHRRGRLALVGQSVAEGAVGGSLLGALVYFIGLERSDTTSPDYLGPFVILAWAALGVLAALFVCLTCLVGRVRAST